MTKRGFPWSDFVLVTDSTSHECSCQTEQYVTILRYSVRTEDSFEVIWSGFSNADKINLRFVDP